MLQNDTQTTAPTSNTDVQVRPAQHRDIDELLSLDSALPNTTQLESTVLHRLVGDENIDLLVAEENEKLRGYAIVMYRAGYHSARLYSILVEPLEGSRTVHIAKELLSTAEEIARRRGTVTMRLEVSLDNPTAIALYERAGYEQRGQTSDQYYGDNREFLRMRKRFVTEDATIMPVPYFSQGFSFSSGPAALLMAMRYHGYPVPLTRDLELHVWRESTAAFNLNGHGGCSAHGLAVAALKRGFRAHVVAKSPDVPFIEGARDEERKMVVRLAHKSFEDDLRSLGGRVTWRDFDDHDVQMALDNGAIPIVLLTGHRVTNRRGAHWVVITGYDSKYLYVNDPYIPENDDPAEGVHLALPRKLLRQLSRHGKNGNRSMLVVSRWGGVQVRGKQEPLDSMMSGSVPSDV